MLIIPPNPDKIESESTTNYNKKPFIVKLYRLHFGPKHPWTTSFGQRRRSFHQEAMAVRPSWPMTRRPTASPRTPPLKGCWDRGGKNPDPEAGIAWKKQVLDPFEPKKVDVQWSDWRFVSVLKSRSFKLAYLWWHIEWNIMLKSKNLNLATPKHKLLRQSTGTPLHSLPRWFLLPSKIGGCRSTMKSIQRCFFYSIQFWW